MLVKLYRATDDLHSFGSGACFAADESDAEEYQNNPGFGGEFLLQVEIEVLSDEILSLVSGKRDGIPYGSQAKDAWDRLAEALGKEDVRALRDESQNVIHQAIDSKLARKSLFQEGYEWVVYEDTFPSGAVTWQYLGEKQRI